MQGFRSFAFRGNLLDVASGFMIGAAFTTVVNSLVNDVMMPPLGLVLGGVDFADFFVVLRSGSPDGPYLNLAAAKAAGAVTVNYGVFINAIIQLLIVAFALFQVIRLMGRLAPKQAPAPGPSAEELLLTEIRDLLSKRSD